MKISPHFLFIIFSALFSISGLAQAQSTFIQLHFTDGTQQNFALNNLRKIDFSDTQVRLHQADETIIAWNYNLIDFYRYTDVETNVADAESFSTEIRMDIFPNPATNILNVNYSIPVKETIQIAIYSMSGNRILDQRINNKAESGAWQHDVSDLPSGIYVLMMQGAQFSISKTIIKH